MRDKNLDVYRGCLMLYITCFIHIIYWRTLIGTPLKSLFLIEMPAIFLLAGASYTLSRRKDYKSYVLSRIRRVLIPYWQYALVCIVLCFVAGLWKTNHALRWGDVLDWFVFFDPDTPIPYIGWHVWFVLPYLLLALVIPFAYTYIRKFSVRIESILLVGLLLIGIADFLHASEVTRQLLVYGLFYLGGLYYKQRKSLLFPALLIGSLLYCIYEGYGWDMQLNKFPPNLMYTTYTFLVLFLLGGLMGKVCLFLYKLSLLRRIIDFYSEEGYMIYLYHPFSHLLLKAVTLLSGISVYIEQNNVYLTIYLVAAMFFILMSNVIIVKIVRRILYLCSHIHL